MTTLVRGRQNELMFDSANPSINTPFVVHVEVKSVVILELGGAVPGVLVRVEHAVGNPTLGIWQPLVISDVDAHMSDRNTKMLLDVPGTYRVQVDVGPSPRVAVSAEKRLQDEVYRMAINGVSASPPPCAPVAGGIQPSW